MTALFLQYFGLGDVIFCQSIAQDFIAKGDLVVWPVRPEWVEGLKRAYPQIDFRNYQYFEPELFEIKRRKVFENKPSFSDHPVQTPYETIPLRWTDSIMKVPYRDCMKSKYMYFGRDWQTWKERAMFQRDLTKEKELVKLLGIKLGEPYVLLNRTFRANESGKVLNGFSCGMRIVEMHSIPGFSLFDWSTIIENAREVHTVSTSIIYILELLAPLNPKIFIYIRSPDEKSHQNYEYILQSNDYVLMP